jgi:hypothetical protein
VLSLIREKRPELEFRVAEVMDDRQRTDAQHEATAKANGGSIHGAWQRAEVDRGTTIQRHEQQGVQVPDATLAALNAAVERAKGNFFAGQRRLAEITEELSAARENEHAVLVYLRNNIDHITPREEANHGY